jgi:hypothetical protein
MKKTIMAKLRGCGGINVDLISKNRKGNYIFRRGYFYRMGGDSSNFAEALKAQLYRMNFNAELIDHGDHWVAFNGGASVAKQSHFYAEFIIEEEK